MFESEVISDLKGAVAAAGSLRKLAAQWKCSHTHIHDVLTGRRRPGPRVLGPLGIKVRRSISYEYVGPYPEEGS